MLDRRHILAGLAAVPAVTALPDMAPADPLAALWAEFQAARADLFAAAASDADWTRAMSQLTALEGRALDTPTANLDGAAAAIAWARDEYAARMDGVTDLDTGERLILALLDTALVALRDQAPRRTLHA